MTGVAAALGAAWASFVWPMAWQASVLGLVALGLQRVLGRWSTTAGLMVAGAGLLKFAVPPYVRVPFALADRVAAGLFVAPDERLAAAVASLAVLHLAGAVAALALVAVRARGVRRWRLDGEPVSDGGLLDAYRHAASALGWAPGRALPRLLWGAAVDSPVAIGVWRPAVLVPRGFERLPRGVAGLALAHELAHHRRHDLAVEWGLVLLTAAWWWHPVVHGLARAVRALREQRADGDVVGSGLADAGEYCAALLAVARSEQRPLALAAGTGAGHPLKARMRRLLDLSPPSRRVRRAAVAAAWVFVITALPAATGRWRPPSGPVRQVTVEQHVIKDSIVVVDIR
ncbi:MAG: M56 family metallopeptidase [Vicinamibacterales bacterium]